MTMPQPEALRLDKWLWAARFFKTRSLSSDEIGKGRVSVNGVPAKASRELRPGDRVELRQSGSALSLVVMAVCAQRRPASEARTMYEETTESVALREKLALQRRLAPEPAQTIDQGRPTKRDRRDLVDWNRWSASVDNE